MSPCGSDHLFTSTNRDGWRMASEDSDGDLSVFPADCPHRTHCHRLANQAGSAGYSEFPAYSQLHPWDRSRGGQTRACSRVVYLRTVIVTAAVYRGFSLQLRGEPLTAPLNLPAPGRRQTLYVVLTT